VFENPLAYPTAFNLLADRPAVPFDNPLILPTSINARQTSARSELFLCSVPVSRFVGHLKADMFELIEEPLCSAESGGCGFIPDHIMIELLGANKAGRRATSITVLQQQRIVHTRSRSSC
jgi:hypothetical protein